jgi:hypothetical protein
MDGSVWSVAIDAGCSGGTEWQVVAHEIESLFMVLGLLVSVCALARAFKKAERWRDVRMPSLASGSATIAVFIGPLFVGGRLAVRLGLAVSVRLGGTCVVPTAEVRQRAGSDR